MSDFQIARPYQQADWGDAYDKAFARGNALRLNSADMAAGQSLAAGDYKGGANALYGAGDITGGQGVEDAASTRDYRASTAKRQDNEAALKVVTGVADRLSAFHAKYKDPARTLAAFDEAAPALQQYAGETPEQIAQIRAALAKDPEGTLSALGAGLKKYQLANGGEGYLGSFDPEAGTLTELRPGTPKPLQLDPKKDIWVPDVAAPAAPAAAPTGEASVTPSSTPGRVDPDAVWRSIKTQETGGEASPGTAVGPDTQYGNALGSTQMLPATAEAMARKLGIPWNPALMRENSPKALDYQDKLGRAYFEEGMQQGGGDPAAGAAYYFGGPDPKLHGPKTRAYVQQVMARAGGSVGPDPALAGGAAGDTVQIPGYHLVHRGETPEETATVDPKVVQGLIDGRLAPPTQKAAATPYWQAQLSAAMTQDPSFDGVNFQARQRTRVDFTSGKAADNVRALNTVVGHLDDLDRSIDGLGNYEGFLGSHLNNQLAQQIAKASNTDQRIKRFETAKTAVSNELTRVFRGTGGAEADIQAWQRQLDAASGPEALHNVVQQMADLINSRIGALGDQYNQGMGTTHEPLTLLTPEKQKAFNRMMGGRAASAEAGPQAGGPLDEARAAIAKGAPREAVIQRLRQHGIDPQGL